MDRYEKQWRFAPLGKSGQEALSRRRVLVIGVGALGSAVAELLTRAGIGQLRIVDRDFLQLSNLQRQSLYNESDVARGIPKAIAAAERLRSINSSIAIEPIVKDINHRTLPAMVERVDLIVDGTDNFETRFLINDLALKTGLPWIFGGCIGAQGQTLNVLPGETICLRCLLPQGPPPADALETCDHAGVLGPIIQIVAAVQAMEAIKWLAGRREAMNPNLQVFSIWDNRWQQIKVNRATMSAQCPTCSGQEYPWLTGQRGSQTQVLCGRNSVQIRPAEERELDLAKFAALWQTLGEVTHNEYLVKLHLPELEITLFPDARAIIYGTDEVAMAKSIYSRYVGN